MKQVAPDLPEDTEDKLFADWVEGLPDPPPGLVEATLDNLWAKTSPRPATAALPGHRWRWLVLGGMAACVALVITGFLTFITLNNTAIQTAGSPTAVGQVQIPTVTPGAASTAIPALPVAPTTTPNTPAPTSQPATNAPATATIFPVSQSALQSISDTTTGGATPTNNSQTTLPATAGPGQPNVSTAGSGAPTRPDLPTVPPARSTPLARPTSTPTSTAPAVTTAPAAAAPTTAPSGPATPIVGVVTIPASASPGAARTFSGQLASLTATSLTLNNLTNVFILNPATRVKINGQTGTVSALQVGQNVVVQAAPNAQGNWVVLEISTTLKVLPKPTAQPPK